MFELTFGILALGLLTLLALPVILLLGFVFLMVKLVFSLVLLPVKVAFWGISGALKFTGFLVKIVLGALIFGFIAVLILGVFLIPLIPVALLAGLGWLIYRFFRPAKAAITT